DLMLSDAVLAQFGRRAERIDRIFEIAGFERPARALAQAGDVGPIFRIGCVFRHGGIFSAHVCRCLASIVSTGISARPGRVRGPGSLTVVTVPSTRPFSDPVRRSRSMRPGLLGHPLARRDAPLAGDDTVGRVRLHSPKTKRPGAGRLRGAISNVDKSTYVL